MGPSLKNLSIMCFAFILTTSLVWGGESEMLHESTVESNRVLDQLKDYYKEEKASLGFLRKERIYIADDILQQMDAEVNGAYLYQALFLVRAHYLGLGSIVENDSYSPPSQSLYRAPFVPGIMSVGAKILSGVGYSVPKEVLEYGVTGYRLFEGTMKGVLQPLHNIPYGAMSNGSVSIRDGLWSYFNDMNWPGVRAAALHSAAVLKPEIGIAVLGIDFLYATTREIHLSLASLDSQKRFWKKEAAIAAGAGKTKNDRIRRRVAAAYLSAIQIMREKAGELIRGEKDGDEISNDVFQLNSSKSVTTHSDD